MDWIWSGSGVHLGWIWVEICIWMDMHGYGWIWMDMDGYGWICMDIDGSGVDLGWIWVDLGRLDRDPGDTAHPNPRF